MERVAVVLGARVGLDVDQIADAIWLAQFLTGDERAVPAPDPVPSPGAPAPVELPAQEARRPEGEAAPAPDRTERVAVPASAPDQVDIERAPRTGEAVPDAVRFRSPAAPALARQLEIARAIRPLGWRSPRRDAWRLLERVTADRIARTGLWLAVLARETEPTLDLVLVIDASPRLEVWRRATRELIDVLRSSGAFRTMTTWRLAGDEPELVLQSTSGAVRRGAADLVGPAQRTAMLVISDFAGALWKTTAGLACVRLWSQRTMLALLSLVPQRSWGRTLLGALPATRLAAVQRGRPSAMLHSEAAVVDGAVPVPVVSFDPASLGTWARLVAGHPHVRGRGVLALRDAGPVAHADYAAAAIRAEDGGDAKNALAALTHAALTGRAAEPVLDARARVERFCETHRPEVVELAAALVSAPLELSVMLVVQRAVAPRTGTLELAEIIDGGLFEIEPPRAGDDEVRFRIADDVRDHLSPRASIGGHLRVLEAVGAYLRDHLGSSIDFEALVVDPSRPTGPIADKDRRFARMFAAELRRLGIATDALAQLEPPTPGPAIAPEPTASPAIAEFNDSWVVVVGTGVARLPTATRLAATALGRELAHGGFGLRTWGWPGVDSVVASTFARTLRAGGVAIRKRLIRVEEEQQFDEWVREVVSSVVAVILVGGRDGTDTTRNRMRAAAIPVVPFRGSGGIADDEAARQDLASRPEIRDAGAAGDEAQAVVDRVCAAIVDPARAQAFEQLRERLSGDLPAFVRRLRLGPDGRVTITGSPERDDAAAIARAARDADQALLSVALEVLTQLGAWPQVAELAMSCKAIMPAAEDAARAIGTARGRFELWRQFAIATADPLAVLNAVDAASAAGDPSLIRASLQQLAASAADTDYPFAVREFLAQFRETQAVGPFFRWLVDMFERTSNHAGALRAVGRWLEHAPDDAQVVDQLIARAARTAPPDGVRALLEAADRAAPEHRATILRMAVDLARAHTGTIPWSDHEAAVRRLLALIPDDPRGQARLSGAELNRSILASRVCRIVRPRNANNVNTGFLVAPDIVLTAWPQEQHLEQGSPDTVFEFDAGAVTARSEAASSMIRIEFSAETDLALVKITPALGHDRGWFDLAPAWVPLRGDSVTLIGVLQGRSDAIFLSGRVVDTDGVTVAYDLEEIAVRTRGTGGGPVVDTAGNLVAVHYRREAGAREFARRRGIAASWLSGHHGVCTFAGVPRVTTRGTLDRLAAQYDRIHDDKPSPDRAMKLDALIEHAGRVAAEASPADAMALWQRATLGARAVALALCTKIASAAPIEIIAESIDEPHSAHEPRIGLDALRRALFDRPALDADPGIMALVRRLRTDAGFSEANSTQAKRALQRYLERCGLPAELEAKLDVIEEWLRAGQLVPDAACMALVGGAASQTWDHGDLAEALGGELTRQGWEVCAGADRDVGSRATTGTKRAGGTARDASLHGGAVFAPSDCVVILGGDVRTEADWSLARARKLPVLALAFTGGVAKRASTMADRDLCARGVPPELLAPIRALSGGADGARLVVRVANVVLARTRARRTLEGPRPAPSLLKVSSVLARELTSDDLRSIAQEVSPDLLGLLAAVSSDLAYDVVVRCAELGVLHRLVLAALRIRPDRIVELTRELHMFPWTGDTGTLSRYLDSLPPHEARSWGRACWELGSCVCEVHVDGRPAGTGFLIGPDAVLTSFHVIGDRGIRATDAKNRLAFVFDRVPMLGNMSAGIRVPAAAGAWQIAASPHMPGEIVGGARGVRSEPTDDELGFALLRLGSAMGAAQRWRGLGMGLETDAPSARLKIIAMPHYLKRSALALTLSDPAEYTPTVMRTRVRYRIDAPPGSSGAPIFDAATWQLLALHQGRARDGRQQGTPIAHIARHPGVQRYMAALATRG